MPSLLLDRHIDEAAMQRRDETPSHYRRGRGQRATQRPTLASVVSSALAAQPAPQPSGRHRGPSPESASLSASPLGLGHDRSRTITFADVLREPDPEWSQPAAEGVRKEARRDAEQAYKALSPGALNAARHVTRYEVPREWLATVPLLSALDHEQRMALIAEDADGDARAFADLELAVVRLAVVASDLALAGESDVVRMALVPVVAQLPSPVSVWDRRPAVPVVGYDLTAVSL